MLEAVLCYMDDELKNNGYDLTGKMRSAAHAALGSEGAGAGG
jgi:hypothetical protein